MADIKDFLNAEGEKNQALEPSHYYGDLVRKLFMASAVIMLIGMPFFHNYIPLPLNLSLLAVVLIGIFAGLANPKHYTIMLLNLIIALVAVISFEYFAIDSFIKQLPYFFVANQLLALLFLFALYYSTKTFRGKVTK